jgi:hypothetical protein
MGKHVSLSLWDLSLLSTANIMSMERKAVDLNSVTSELPQSVRSGQFYRQI